MGDKIVSSGDFSSKESHVKWLVIFFVLDVFELDLEIKELKESMKSIEINDSLKIFLIKDTVQHIKGTTRQNEPIQAGEFRFDRKTGTTTLVPLELPGINTRAGSAWVNTISYFKKKYNPVHSTLITWSHGGAIAILNADARKKALAENEAIIASSPCEKLAVLFVSEMANALKTTAAGRFDMMIMNNCYMQTLDCCYNLKDICQYYIASERGMQSGGYDFVKFITALNATITGTVDFKKIITDLVNGYWERMGEAAEDTAVVANDLTCFTEEWKNAFNNLIRYLRENAVRTFPVLRDITLHRLIDVSSDAFLFDAVALFRNVDQDLGDPVFTQLLQDFLSPLKATLPVYARSGKVILENDANENEVKKFGIHYFSLHLHSPDIAGTAVAKVFDCQYAQQAFQSAFVAETCWDELVIDYIKALPIPTT